VRTEIHERSGSHPQQVEDARSKGMKANGQESRQGESSRAPAGQTALQPVVGRSLHSVGKTVHSTAGAGRAPGVAHRAGDVAYVPTLLCAPPSGRRVRHSQRSGVPGPQGRVYHHDLHACAESRWPGSSEPSGRSINERVFMRIRITRSLEKRLFDVTSSCCGSYLRLMDSSGLRFIMTDPSRLPR